MLKTKLLPTLSLAICTLANAQAKPNNDIIEINQKDFIYQKNGESNFTKIIEIGKDKKAKFSINITSKGNGILEVLNLKIKVYDDHHDGDYYEGGMLKVDIVDINSDGFKDIVITGTLCKETDDGAVTKEPILCIYTYKNNSYTEMYSSHKLTI